MILRNLCLYNQKVEFFVLTNLALALQRICDHNSSAKEREKAVNTQQSSFLCLQSAKAGIKRYNYDKKWILQEMTMNR